MAMTERYTEQDLVTFAASYSRLLLARALGQTAYEGDRDYYEVLGYPASISVADYLARYERQDIAGRLVDLPANDTWKRAPQISEGGDTETAFVKEWKALANRLHVWNMLCRVDRLSGIGRYGVLLIGVRDGDDLAEPIGAGTLKSERDILYLRPFSEDRVDIRTWEDDTGSERYGLPVTYSIKLREDQADQVVHWTRVLHVAEGKLDSEVYGTPRLQRVYNRLDDLIKLVGGGAEATWLNMRPGTMLTNQPDYMIPQDSDSKEERLEEIRRYAHDPLRILMLEGFDAKQVGASEVVDVTGPFDVCIGLISAASGIPQRVLLGSAQGELAAAEYDAKQWAGTIAHRQANYAEPEILRAFIDRLHLFGALPPAEYNIGTPDADGLYRWPLLIEVTESERAEITQRRATAAKMLTHPLTGEMPITDGEQRELLGYPPELPEGEETAQTLAAHGEVVELALVTAMQNYREGAIDADTLAQFAVAEWAEAANAK